MSDFKQGQKVLISGRIYKENNSKEFNIIHDKEMIFNRIVDNPIYDAPNDRVFGFIDENGKEIGFYPEDIFQIKIKEN